MRPRPPRAHRKAQIEGGIIFGASAALYNANRPPSGTGEPGTAAIVGAIGNAVSAAIGERLQIMIKVEQIFDDGRRQR